VSGPQKVISDDETPSAEALHGRQPEIEWVRIALVHEDHRRNAVLCAASRAIPVRLKRRLKRQLKFLLASARMR
jgi:hypothetical protein